MGLAEELMELAQNGTVMCRDGRTTGFKYWITNGLHRREMIDEAEVQALHTILGLKQYPPLSNLPTVSWTILQRIPEAT